jgi:branched-chain amino acid transport system ATP-binding protein
VRAAVTPDAPILRTRDLTKRFGGVTAVDGVSMAVDAGEIRGLIGPNGSGKTTTINLLSGLYRADRGEIFLRDERTERLRPHEIAARGVGRTFQVPKLFGNMTVLENVLLPALAAIDRGVRRPASEMTAEAARLLAFVTLDRQRDAPAKELSGGQAMLAQIARAFMVRPLHLLLMDEPFAGVHPTIRTVIIDAVLRMNRETGVTVLVVSHEMAELRRLCSRVSVMHEGRLIAEGPLDHVANDSRVLEAYLGR